MAINPQLHSTGLPVSFPTEIFAMCRDSVDFEVDNIAGISGNKWSSSGTVYLSSLRMVFVSKSGELPIYAFDLPLAFIREEAFNQPIFFANNLTGKVLPLMPDGSLGPPHGFKLWFSEGGTGTFIPLFFNLLRFLRASMPSAPPQSMAAESHTLTPSTGAAAPQVEKMVRSAYIDPNDPTKIYLQQPN